MATRYSSGKVASISKTAFKCGAAAPGSGNAVSITANYTKCTADHVPVYACPPEVGYYAYDDAHGFVVFVGNLAHYLKNLKGYLNDTNGGPHPVNLKVTSAADIKCNASEAGYRLMG